MSDENLRLHLHDILNQILPRYIRVSDNYESEGDIVQLLNSIKCQSLSRISFLPTIAGNWYSIPPSFKLGIKIGVIKIVFLS